MHEPGSINRGSPLRLGERAVTSGNRTVRCPETRSNIEFRYQNHPAGIPSRLTWFPQTQHCVPTAPEMPSDIGKTSR